MRTTVAVVEDRDTTLESLVFLLGTSNNVEVVGGLRTAAEALERIPELTPDVALVDLGLPDLPGVELIRRLKLLLPSLEILVLTIHEDPKHLFGALKAGASGYLLKDSPPGEILEAIEEVHHGGSPMSRRIARYVIEHFHGLPEPLRSGGGVLTDRERQIVQGIADSLSYRQLASQLGISPHTVRTHIKNVYEKLQVHSKIEAVIRAREAGEI